MLRRFVVWTLALSLALFVGCRREEEDLSSGIDRRQGTCNNNTPNTPSGGQPPAVQLTDGERFLAAAQSGNLSDVQALVTESKIDPLTTDSQGRTALMLAAEMGHTAVVEYLLNLAPSLSAIKDKEGRTATDYVLASASLDDAQKQALTKILSGQTATKEELEAELLTIVQEGFDQQKLTRLRTLLERGASPETQDTRLDGNPVPALFLAMGFRVSVPVPVPDDPSSTSGGSVSLKAEPSYDYAEALVRAGANRQATIVFRRRTVTPLEVLNASGPTGPFASKKAQWDALLTP
jgi:hypothetical protein